MGEAYSYICITKIENGLSISQQTGDADHCDGSPKDIDNVMTDKNLVYLKVSVDQEAKCSFYYSFDGKKYISIGDVFTAKKGKWIGAKIGIFCINPNVEKDNGYADFNWFRIE